MKFVEGDKIFAKVRGYPAWPARILEVFNENSRNPRFNVYFYGTKESAIVKFKDVSPFLDAINTLGTPRKIKYFNEAMADIMRDLSPSERKKLSEQEKSSTAEDSREMKSAQPHSTGTFSQDDSNEGSENPSVSRYGRKFKPKLFPEEVTVVKSPPTVAQPGQIILDVDGERYVIPDEKKRLAFHFKEGDLMELEQGIRGALSVHSPDHVECIKLLTKLLELDFTQLMIRKFPDVVATIRKVRRYYGTLPKLAAKEEKEMLLKKSEIIRHKAEMIYKKIEDLFPVPEGKTFMEYFDEVKAQFDQEYNGMTIQDRLDLVDV